MMFWSHISFGMSFKGNHVVFDRAVFGFPFYRIPIRKDEISCRSDMRVGSADLQPAQATWEQPKQPENCPHNEWSLFIQFY